MKRIFLLGLLLLAVIKTQAQNGEFIYCDFEPDLSATKCQDTIWVDFDSDGRGDVYLYMTSHSTGGHMAMIGTSDLWELGCLQENDADTIAIPDIVESWEKDYSWFMNQDKDRFVARKHIEGRCLYAWFRAYWYPTWEPYICHLNFDKFAFCAIPDYPLCWGQTSFAGIEESVSATDATLYPNPTTGLVTVTGENLRKAEVANALGQKVLCTQSEGNELLLDMSTLPSGVYFVTVTDKEGRKCVRKVVKE